MLSASSKDRGVAETLLRIHQAKPFRPREANPVSRGLETGQPLFVPRVSPALWSQRFGGELAKEAEGLGVHSLITVPIRFYGGSGLGVLSLMRYGGSGEPFSEQDLLLVQSFAEHVAMAISNATLFGEKQRELVDKRERLQRLHVLSELSTELAEVADDPQRLIDKLSTRVSALFAGCCLVQRMTESGTEAIAWNPQCIGPRSAPGEPPRDPALRPELSGGSVPESAFWQAFASPEPRCWLEIPWASLPAETQQVCRELAMGSLMSAPLVARGKVMGVLLTFRTQNAPPYTEEDCTFFREVVSKAALFLLNADLSQAQQRELHEKQRLSDRLQFLSDSTRDFVAEEGDIESLLEHIVQRFVRALGGSCVLMLLGAKPPKNVRTYHADPSIHAALVRLAEYFPQPIPGGFIERIIQSQKPLFLPELDPSYLVALIPDQTSSAVSWVQSLGLHSMLVVPLVSQGRTVGVATMLRHHQEAPHTEDDLRFLLDLTAHAALSIINANLVQSLQQELAERAAAEQALKRTEDQLWHAQKMEAIGRLAGGIAHDFNNVLSVIMGYSELALLQFSDQPDLVEPLHEIGQAAERAAKLTKQLLAFSRQQLSSPEVVDLNQVIRGTEKMLQRLIGANIELTLDLQPDLYNVNADAGQIEQVLWNLLVNARDAIPGCGKIAITTRNTQVNSDSAEHPGLAPGSYAVIAVRDDGSGMDKATQEQIFEPFFTTKGKGRGTGLGLFTVFGIVQQHRGAIQVSSSPGAGATFTLLFPQTHEVVPSSPPPAQRSRHGGGTQRILLAEDDAQLRKMVSSILQSRGYHVFVAVNGKHALQILEANPAPIDLLLTDVVMPELSGPELAVQALRILPQLKVLFMSGYTDDTFGSLDTHGMELLPKPMTPDTLLRKIEQVLQS